MSSVYFLSCCWKWPPSIFTTTTATNTIITIIIIIIIIILIFARLLPPAFHPETQQLRNCFQILFLNVPFISWFQTFALFWMLYSLFWVIPRRLNFMFRRFGTLCLFRLHRSYGQEESRYFFSSVPLNSFTSLTTWTPLCNTLKNVYVCVILKKLLAENMSYYCEEREREKTNKMQQSDVYYQHCLNVFRASLCPKYVETVLVINIWLLHLLCPKHVQTVLIINIWLLHLLCPKHVETVLIINIWLLHLVGFLSLSSQFAHDARSQKPKAKICRIML